MEHQIVGDEKGFIRHRRNRNAGHRRNDLHPHAHGIGLTMLQHGDEAEVRRSLVFFVQPMMQAVTDTGERGQQNERSQQSGEKRFAERAHKSRCSFDGHAAN